MKQMKPFADRNLRTIGILGIVVVAVLLIATLQYQKLPFINPGREYSAYFSDASGLKSGQDVQVSGFTVGKVSSLKLDGAKVLITFKIDKSAYLGDQTEAAIKTKSLLGAKVLELTPRGDGDLTGSIPLERTTAAYQLPDALGDLSLTVSNLDTNQLNESLATLATSFKDTAPHLQVAVEGVSRFATTLNERDTELRRLLFDADKVTAVLAQRSDQVLGLVENTNALLVDLQTQSAALDQISGNITALATQVSRFTAENQQTLKPALDKLNGVLTIVDNRKERVLRALKFFNLYAISLGESLAGGPFFNAYIANLLPGQFVQPFVDAAFSDLGLDPNVQLPSELSDPEIGQAGTPPLPVPFPRTGQGGDPNLTLPEAITGNPGDLRYPYKEPLPAPPPGGPPPGPPAQGVPAPALPPSGPGVLPGPPPGSEPTEGQQR
jgi:phospholipid/cholesterol/gamma-HCH transport system substrate-binding protein